jgi:glycosyltransferase involved in cell wall biosynthesis
MGLHICFLTLELFNWGRYGGIGKITRDLGRNLVKQGLEVCVIMPAGVDQRPVEMLDGMKVYSHKLWKYPISRTYKKINADIYHSQEPSWGTIKAHKMHPKSVHITTIQNPKTSDDWKRVNRYYKFRRKVFNKIYYGKIKKCLQKQNKVYCQARYTIQKTRNLYNLSYDPTFLPNPVKIPKGEPKKSIEPLVCFLGRFDGEKQPEHFFKLSKKFPKVKFIAAGKSHNRDNQIYLEKIASGIPNLTLTGFINGEEKKKLLESCWILVNTSISECLPVSFLEAAANKCSILSYHNPDRFSSRGGIHVNNLETGLKFLLEGELWRKKGKEGYLYVKEHHDLEKVVKKHIIEYKKLSNANYM